MFSVCSPALIADPSILRSMSKQQTGLRIDRVLFKRFQELCAVEKLRPGEAVEALVRLAVDTGGITSLGSATTKHVQIDQSLDEVLFRSKLSRLKASLEAERRYWTETGEEVEEPDSELHARDLTEICRRSGDEEFVKEFEAVLVEADKLHHDIERGNVEQWIRQRQGRRPYDHPGLIPEPHVRRGIVRFRRCVTLRTDHGCGLRCGSWYLPVLHS